jgi:hypothetical protein
MSLQSWLQRFVVRSTTDGDPHGSGPVPDKERTVPVGPNHPVHGAPPPERRAVSGLVAFTLVALISACAGALLTATLLPTRPAGDAATPPPPVSPALDRQVYNDLLDPTKLPVGCQARDFALPEITSGQTVRLSDFRGHKPVVLIFGSTTSPTLRNHAGLLEELHQTYRRRAAFLFVHLRQAGAVPAAGPPGDPHESVRQALASLPLTMPCVLDGAHGDAERWYQAGPQRLVIVGADGRIALDAGRGLYGWDLAEVEDWLKEQKP